MLTKRTYFILVCDARDEAILGGLCRNRREYYTRPESEGAAAEVAIKRARADGWKVVSKGAHQGFNTLCPEHRTTRTKSA